MFMSSSEHCVSAQIEADKRPSVPVRLGEGLQIRKYRLSAYPQFQFS